MKVEGGSSRRVKKGKYEVKGGGNTIEFKTKGGWMKDGEKRKRGEAGVIEMNKESRRGDE